jgi:hypothetical protein
MDVEVHRIIGWMWKFLEVLDGCRSLYIYWMDVEVYRGIGWMWKFIEVLE